MGRREGSERCARTGSTGTLENLVFSQGPIGVSFFRSRLKGGLYRIACMEGVKEVYEVPGDSKEGLGFKTQGDEETSRPETPAELRAAVLNLATTTK